MVSLVKRFHSTISSILSRKGFARNVVVLAVGTATGQAFTALATPILTRLYTPGALGTWTIVMSFALILAVVANWRYEFAIMLPDSDEDSSNIKTLATFISVLMTIVVIVIIGIFNHQLAHLLGIEDYAQWLWFVPVILLLRGL